jgi:hypothetical protein
MPEKDEGKNCIKNMLYRRDLMTSVELNYLHL